MGGDCLNFGYVPSKGLIASARLVQAIRDAEKLGLKAQEPQFFFEKIWESMRARRAKIEPHDSQERFESLGADVFRGQGRFVSPYEMEVDGQRLRAKHFVIAARSRARVPPIEGLQEVPYLTNETFFDELKQKPQRIVIMGGGPIGCEMGQVCNRLGVTVHLINMGPKLLPKEDPDIAAFMLKKFQAEGMQFHLGLKAKRVAYREGLYQILVERSDGGGQTETLEAEVLLVATGRIPNLEGLNLEAAGVAFTPRGITVDASLRTSQKHIYAAGDIAGSYQFTHMADYHARIVVENIVRSRIFPLRVLNQLAKTDYRCLPWSTYTSPEIGRVGLNETEANKKGIAYDVYKIEMSEEDRAVVEGCEEGFVKVLAKKGTDQILGVTLLGAHGGDLVHEFVLAMQHGIGLKKISSTIHAYPTFAEIVRKVGDAYNKTRLTPKKHAFLKRLFTRQIS